MFKFHNLQKRIVALSPMDGVTDCAYREIVKRYGQADLLYTEFVNVHGLTLGIDRLFQELRYTPNQRVVLAQIYGYEVEYFYPAALICLALGFNGVDINMGCPAKKISDKGAGAGLIRTPENAKEIIREVKKAREFYRKLFTELSSEIQTMDEYIEVIVKKVVQEIMSYEQAKRLKISDIKVERELTNSLKDWNLDVDFITSQERLNLLTVSLKTRIGYEVETVEEWIGELIKVDPDFIAIHGRTLKQMYSGHADWNAIAKAIKKIKTEGKSIPVLANGDIKTVEDAKQCLAITNADGLLVGRGTYGDPQLIKGIQNLIIGENFEQKEMGFEYTKKVMLDHCNFFKQFKGESRFFEMRKNLAWSIQGFPNASDLRKRLVLASSLEEVSQILDSIQSI